LSVAPFVSTRWRNVDELLFLSPPFLALWPVATSTVAATGQITERRTGSAAAELTIQIARQIAVAALSPVRARRCGAMAAVRYPAALEALAENKQAGDHAIPADGPPTKR